MYKVSYLILTIWLIAQTLLILLFLVIGGPTAALWAFIFDLVQFPILWTCGYFHENGTFEAKQEVKKY